VDSVPFSSLTQYSFPGTLHHSITLRTGDKQFENYHEASPFYTSYDTGMFVVRKKIILF
jgi:hypothetical protein